MSGDGAPVRSTNTKTWVVWTLDTADFLAKVGLPPETSLIDVRIDFHARKVILTESAGGD